MTFSPSASAELQVAWLWGHQQLAPILMFLWQLVIQLLWPGMETMGLTVQLPRETWDCAVAKKPLMGVSMSPEMAGGGPLLPQETSWAQADNIPYCSQAEVAHVPYTQSPHSCLSSGRVSWALAEVHLFMLFTNCQRNFIGWAEWRVNKTRRRKERKEKAVSAP